ncbi:MAG TPA: hypothetical protein VNK04_25030 [Gemmataceae bacterium]|nr:hypothetical protein [Gemmataceae bacterium]
MPAIIEIACPDCGKELRVRAELEGKKVRCKECGSTFTVRAPTPKKAAASPKAAAPKKPTSPIKPAKTGSPGPTEDEYDNPNPYRLVTFDTTPRCPHCAFELETRDAVICINCGYNLETREHLRTVKTVETTTGEQFLWLLPGILCVIALFLLIGLDIYWCLVLPEQVADDDVFWILASGPVTLWMVILSLFGMYACAKFAVKRLILNPVAPEKEKR